MNDGSKDYDDLRASRIAPEGTRVYALLEREGGDVLSVDGGLPGVRMGGSPAVATGPWNDCPLHAILTAFRNTTGILIDYAGCTRGRVGETNALYWNAIVRILGHVPRDFHPERVTTASLEPEVARLRFQLAHYVPGVRMVFAARAASGPRTQRDSPAFEELNGYPLTEGDVDSMVARRETLGPSIFRGHDVGWRWRLLNDSDQAVLDAVRAHRKATERRR